MKRVIIDLEKLSYNLNRKQSAVAKEIGCTQASISYKLKGVRPMSLDQLNKICSVLGRDTTDFLLTVNSD